MKLASLKGGRDGRLVVVSNDLAWFTEASHIARTLQFALDNWDLCEPELRGLAESLEHGAVPKDRFHEHNAESPLPRAFQWADGSAYVNHVALVRKARAADMPGSFWTDPLMYQGGSDGFLGPRDPIPLAFSMNSTLDSVSSGASPAAIAPAFSLLCSATYSLKLATSSSLEMRSAGVKRPVDEITGCGACDMMALRVLFLNAR